MLRNRILVLILIICLLTSVSPLSAFSDSSTIQSSYKWTSPVEANRQTMPKYASSTTAVTSYAKVYSLEELKYNIRRALYNRETTMNINYIGDTTALDAKIVSMINQILDADDYLKYSMSSWQFGYSGFVGDVNIDFAFSYLTTLDEEAYVDTESTRILNEIIYPEMDDHQKVRAVHDYIVSHVAYDTSLVEHSAYAALSKGTTVCQGYALLTFKLIKQLGINIRIVEGNANGSAHAWNLVNLDGVWYHLDSTWDDPIPDSPGRVLYNYFNVTDSQIGANHIWNHGNYPAASTTYIAQPYGIIRFEVPGQLGQTTINHQNAAITFKMPAGSDIKALAANIILWYGATMEPASTEAQDFSTPVIYKVTKADGNIEEWTITCQLEQTADCNLDGRIDIDDLTILALTYGLKKGEAGYDSRADVTKDDMVDVNDLSALAANFTSR